MVIAVTRGQKIESFAAVDRAKRARIQNVNGIGGFRVRVNFAEIPGALTKPAVVVPARPFLAGVIGAVQAAFLCFNNRVNAVWIGAGNGDPDLAKNSVGQSVALKLFPGNAVV